MNRIKLACTLLLALLLSACANGLFYYPSKLHFPNNEIGRLSYDDVYFNSKDGTRLHGWFLKAKGPAKATIVHFHGNAQNITTHVSYVAWLTGEGYNVFVFDYRGYGESEGKPSREGVYEDSLAAVSYVESRPDVDKGKLILFGQSLGAGQAITVAGSGQFPELRAVIEESGFSAYRRIAREKMTQMPLGVGYLLWPFTPLLISGGHNPDEAIAHIAPVPLLIIHGRNDEVVPYSHAGILYAAAGSPKFEWTLERAGHTEALGRLRPTVAPRLLKFLTYAISHNPADLDPADQSAAGLKAAP
jgi:fermentation-respiration switch protein FrsA (DUF1100 family)